jgi:hypothetical protein
VSPRSRGRARPQRHHGQEPMAQRHRPDGHGEAPALDRLGMIAGETPPTARVAHFARLTHDLRHYLAQPVLGARRRSIRPSWAGSGEPLASALPASLRLRSGDTVTTRSWSGLSPLRAPVTALDARCGDNPHEYWRVTVSPVLPGETGVARLAGPPSSPPGRGSSDRGAGDAPQGRRCVPASDVRPHSFNVQANRMRWSAIEINS